MTARGRGPPCLCQRPVRHPSCPRSASLYHSPPLTRHPLPQSLWYLLPPLLLTLAACGYPWWMPLCRGGGPACPLLRQPRPVSHTESSSGTPPALCEQISRLWHMQTLAQRQLATGSCPFALSRYPLTHPWCARSRRRRRDGPVSVKHHAWRVTVLVECNMCLPLP